MLFDRRKAAMIRKLHKSAEQTLPSLVRALAAGAALAQCLCLDRRAQVPGRARAAADGWAHGGIPRGSWSRCLDQQLG